MADDLTIQQAHDDLIAQLQHGATAVLSSANLPSPILWTLVGKTLSASPGPVVTRIVISPASPLVPVQVSAVVGTTFTVTGKVTLLNIQTTTTITVSVVEGVADLAFTLTPPASWTLGQSFQVFNNRWFDQWRSQLVGVNLQWSSNGKTAADALVLAASMVYSGVYNLINVLYSGQSQEPFTQAIAFGEYGPTLNAQIPILHKDKELLRIGPVKVKSPYFATRLVYVPSDEDETILEPRTSIGLAWKLDSQNAAVADFEILARIADDSSILTVTGGYPDDQNALSLTDIVSAMYGQDIAPPNLPGPLQFLATDVGLQHFGLSLNVSSTPSLRSAQIYIATKPSSPGWVIIGPSSDPLLALQEIHFSYSSVNAGTAFVNSVRLGGTLRISRLLFSADVAYTTAGADYAIDGRGVLTTADGLPLRFHDLIAGLGAPSVAAAFDDFLELSFTEVGASIQQTTIAGVTRTSWSAYADAELKLKFFGQEFLGLHNTSVAVSGAEVGGQTVYTIAAQGEIYILGLSLPASLMLSDADKTFKIGPISFTLGDLITWMVNIIHPSWNYELPEPWNALNAIGFENLTLEFDLENETVTLDTGVKADFGFVSLDSVRLTYHKRTSAGGKQGVIFAMKGRFLGLPIEVTTDDPDLQSDEMGWDLVNGKPIEVPGAGDQLFKLEYLGIGQHVSFRDTRSLKSIGDVMTALENNFRPVGDVGDNPLANQDGLIFAEDSGWLIGTKFSVLETVTISAIFNDPQLYGLRIELAGEKAQSLSGLQFEILYKKITDTIGLYHIDLRLPDAIRQLEFGEVSVTIPEFVLDIYTNGNFKIDVGFPYRLDFSRSFSVEVFPFVGFGGFYFGYLEGATSDRVPTISDGDFKPVLEFGLGLSIGVGKTIEKGMLRAGATLVVEGLVEGVLAWFNPDDAARETAMFYSIAGAVGIEGRVYGSIDFKIIKASIDITASARVTLMIECYQPIDIALNVSVSARVSVKILFVTIHCSFSLDLNLQYTIGHATTPPWTIDHSGGRQQSGLVYLRHDARNEHARLRWNRARRLARARQAAPLDLSVVTRASLFVAQDEPVTTIPLRFRPFFTQSDQPSLANDQNPPIGGRARSVAMLFTAVPGQGPDTSFATLAELCFQRVAAAALAQKPSQKDRLSLYDLSVIKHQLDLGLHDPDFLYDALVAFFTAAGITFEIDASPQSAQVGGTFFPMIPALTLTDTLSDAGGNPQHFVSVDYSTDPRFMVDETYETIVDDYFRLFQVSSETLVEQQAAGASIDATKPGDTPTESMAKYVFRDYFLMITQSMIDAAIAYLDAYPYEVPDVAPDASSQSLDAIAAATSAPDDLHDENPTALSIASANLTATDILDGAAVSATDIAGAAYQANNGESLADIAGRFGVSVTALAATVNPDFGIANAAGPNMINSGVQIDLGDITFTTPLDVTLNLDLVALQFFVSPTVIQSDPDNHDLDFTRPFPPNTTIKIPAARYVLQPTDTLSGLALAFQTSLDILVTRNSALKTLVRALSIWTIPTFRHTYADGDSLQSIAQTYALPLARLLADGYAAAAIIKAGAKLTIPYRPDIPATDIYAAMGATAVTGPIAATISRFMMHGLRLPQISPLTFDTMKPFYDNLGQQIDVPAQLLDQTGYTYALQLASAAPKPDWIAFAGGGATATYAYTAADISEIEIYAATYAPGSVSVRQMPMMAYAPNRYPLRQVIHWQSPHGLTPVTGAPSDGNSEPNIWSFPASLCERLLGGPSPDANGDAETTLKYAITVGRQEKPNGPPVFTPVDNFAWASTVEIGVKRVMAGSTGNVAVKNDYLISSADPSNRETLYRLWTHMADPAYADTAEIYILSRADPASQSGRGVISQDLVAANTSVIKTNLSTTSNPPSQRATLEALEASTVGSGIAAAIDDPVNFLRLIWEGVTLNSGGFYLNYTEAGTQAGLPDALFDAGGAADVQLLVIFGSQRHVGGTLAGQPPMLKMSNCVVLSDHLDLANAELLVEAANFKIEEGLSLTAVQTAMGFATMADFVAVNQTIKVLVRVGLTIAVGPGVTVQAGDSLASLAARTGVSALDVANAIAADVDALIPGALCQYALGQMRLMNTGAVGSVGIEVTRPNPDADDAAYADLTPQQKRDLMFNLLGVDLDANTWFQPAAMTTGAGQSAGHASEWPAAGPLEPQDASDAVRAATWIYHKIVPYSDFATPTTNVALPIDHLPPADRNPYAGLAPSSAIALKVHFQDNFGNRIDGGGASGALAIPVGYRDNIQALAAWPGLATSYVVQKADTRESPTLVGIGGTAVEIDAGFRVSTYVSGDGQSVDQARKRVAADQEKLRQIYYQIIQPDLQFTMTSTLDSVGGVASTYSLPKSYFLDFANAGLLFFKQQLELVQVATAGVAGDTLTTLDDAWLINDSGAFLKANMAAAVGAIFDLAAPDATLSVPVTILARTGQSLVNLAASASAAMGVTITENQLAGLNAVVPLMAEVAVAAPQRTIPDANDPQIGDQTLARVADLYRSTIADLAAANAADKTILRAGTALSLQGVDYAVVAGDSFDDVVAAFLTIPVAPARDTFQKLADARGLSTGALAFANETDTTILADGAAFNYPDPAGGGVVTVQAQSGDSLYAVAAKVAAQLPQAVITVESLVSANKDTSGLLIGTAFLHTGLTRVSTDAVANANANVVGLFEPTAHLKTAVYRLQPADTITSIVARFAAIDPTYDQAKFVAANIQTGGLMPSGAQLLAGVKSVAPDPSQTLSDFAVTQNLTLSQIGAFNPDKPLAVTGAAKFLVPERTSATGLSFGAVQPAAGRTLAQAAALFGLSAAALVQTNIDMWRTLKPGQTIALNGTSVVTTASDTFGRIWTASGGGGQPDYAALAAAIDAAGAYRDGAVLIGPAAKTGPSDIKPTDLATAWNVAVDDLLIANCAIEAFLKPGAVASFAGADGPVSLTVRPKETINTLRALAASTAGLSGLDRKGFFAGLAATPGLIAAAAVFVVPPTLERTGVRVNRSFPAKLFRLALGVQLSRVNFKVTSATITALGATPGVTVARAQKLAAMAAAAELYIDGDAFDAALRTAFGAETDIDYLISMTRRCAVLPTVLIDPSFADAPAAQSVETLVPAHAAAESVDDGAQSLTAFATAFEAAFDGEVKVCVSSGGDPAQPSQSVRQLWAADFSADGYGFTVQSGQQSFFARKPISNRLLGEAGVPMRYYVSGANAPVVGGSVDVKQVDLDVWAKQFFETMDLALSPECAVTLHQHAPDALSALVALKDQLADKASGQLAQLIDNGRPGDLALAAKSFADRLKIRLADAYKIETVLQFPVTVVNGGPESPGLEPPRLFGQPVNLPYVTAQVETLASIASALRVSQPYVTEIIGDMPGILNLGPDGRSPITVAYTPTGATAQPTAADSLTTLAVKLGVPGDRPAQGLIDAITVTPPGRGLFAPNASINALPVTYAPPTATTIEAVALALDVSVLQLALAMQDTEGLFNTAVTSLTWRYEDRPINVPVTSTSTLNTLAAAFAAAGVTPAPDAVTTANYFRIDPANLVAANAALSIVEVLPNYGFSATAAPLSTSGSALTFFLEVANRAQAKKLFMNLDFLINQIEHGIQAVPGASDYENSAWLSFLVPFDTAGGSTDSRIGLVEVPIPNQTYPDMPILIGQSGVATPLPASPTVEDLKLWNYAFEFEYRAAAQDLIYTGVTINNVVGMNRSRAALDADPGQPTNLLEALAQFNANYRALMDDLQLLPFLSPDNLQNPAVSAGPVLAEFAARIAQFWNVLPPQSVSVADVVGAHGYAFTMTRAREQDAYLDTLIMTAQQLGETLWPDAVQVKTSTGEWRDLASLTPTPTTEAVFRYPEHLILADTPLTHRVIFQGLDVIVSQSARASVHVTRNETLSSQGTTFPAFVYQTPVVAAYDDLTPLVARTDPYFIPAQPAPDNDLVHALSAYFKQVFDIGTAAWPLGATRLIALHVAYRFDLAQGQPPGGSNLTPQTPVLLISQHDFQLKPATGSPDYEPVPGTFVTAVGAAVQQWINTNLDPGQSGRLVFDLSAFEAKASDTSRPVLKLSTLLWDL